VFFSFLKKIKHSAFPLPDISGTAKMSLELKILLAASKRWKMWNLL
jgi:hypothetical protein